MKLLLIITISFCIKCIYDARKIVKDYFRVDDEIKTIEIVKLCSFAVIVLCLFIARQGNFILLIK